MKRSKKRTTDECQNGSKKKMKQMTLFESFQKSPRVVVTPLRIPLDSLKTNSDLDKECSNLTVKMKLNAQLQVNGKSKSSHGSKSQIGSETEKKVSKSENIYSGDNRPNKKSSKTKTVAIQYLDIPKPKLVNLPPGLENAHFGDALFISQFMSDFRGALKLPKSIHLSTDKLLKAISLGVDGYEYVSLLFQYCAQAAIKDIKAPVELGVSVADVPLTIHSLSEVVRLFLIHKKYQDNNLLNVLESQEIYQLAPVSMINILSFLCTEVLHCRMVERYYNEYQKQETNLIKQRASMINLEKEIAAKKLKLSEMDKPESQEQPLNENENGLSTSSFYGPSSTTEADDDDSFLCKPKSSIRKLMNEKMRTERAKAELQKQERIKEEQELLKMETTIEKFETDSKVVSEELKRIKRVVPLGCDRNNNRYWWFNQLAPNLIVETDWQNTDLITSTKWFTYDDTKLIEKLVKSLCEQNHEERLLKSALQSKLNEVKDPEPAKEVRFALENSSDWNANLIDSFKSELIKAKNIIVSKNLGRMENAEEWGTELQKSDALIQLKCFLIQLYECLYPSSNKEATDDEESLKKWIDAVKECQTLSRLHLLLSVLGIYFDWDNANYRKCKICRNGRNKQIVRCNDCDQIFHLFCLKPRLSKIPEDIWLCASCAPNSVEKLKAESSESCSESDDSNDEDFKTTGEELKCCRCNRKDNTVFGCSECGIAFHKNCHKPPLRYPPRVSWMCTKCRQSTSIAVNKPKIVPRPQPSGDSKLRRSQRLRE